MFGLFRRLGWLIVGWVAGATTMWWATRRVRRVVERYAPPEVRDRMAHGARRAGGTIRDAVQEGRVAMRDREAVVRAAFDARTGGGRDTSGPTPGPSSRPGLAPPGRGTAGGVDGSRG